MCEEDTKAIDTGLVRAASALIAKLFVEAGNERWTLDGRGVGMIAMCDRRLVVYLDDGGVIELGVVRHYNIKDREAAQP